MWTASNRISWVVESKSFWAAGWLGNLFFCRSLELLPKFLSLLQNVEKINVVNMSGVEFKSHLINKICSNRFVLCSCLIIFTTIYFFFADGLPPMLST
jgi:hypothetical protein